MKSWLAQGSSGRRVTLLPGTTFLHILHELKELHEFLGSGVVGWFRALD